jgi:hypothetical protein
MKIAILTFFLLLLISSCIDEWDKELKKTYINHKIIRKHKDVRENEIDIKIKQNKNTLELFFDIGPFNKLTAFNIFDFNWYLRFFYNGQIIKIPPYFNTEYYYNSKYKGKAKILNYFVSNKSKTNKSIKYSVKIPLFLLQEIKQGKQKLIAELYAKQIDTFLTTKYQSYSNNYFTDSLLKNSYSIKEVEIPELSIRFLFEIDMPSVYLSQLCLKEIILQDDENFSPRGMDFSFRDGLPDIYWTISHPVENLDDIKNLYWKSREATYAYNYTFFDTINILHFSKKDKIIIGVYDRDDFSKDDFIGDWYGHLLTLYRDTFKSLQFDYIISFKIKAKYKGCVNCL